MFTAEQLARDGFDAAVHRPHLSYEECVERYPLLTRALQWVLIGSQSEAGCCIRDYRDGHRYGGEAVSHSGLSPKDRVHRAWQIRKSVRDSHAHYRKARAA